MVYVNVTTNFANLLYDDDDDELHLSCRKAAIPRLSFRIIRGVVYCVPGSTTQPIYFMIVFTTS